MNQGSLTTPDHEYPSYLEHVGWFNHDRLHESLDDRPPAEIEALHAARTETTITI